MTERTEGRRNELDHLTGATSGTRDPATTTPSDHAPGSPPANGLPLSKFTVLLDHEAAADFDQLALDIRRLLGRRVSKGELVRALLARATQDRLLREHLLDELRAHRTT